MTDLRVETIAVQECHRGNMDPLMELLEPLQNPAFALLLCLTIKKSPAAKTPQRDLIGCKVELMLRKRPGEKKMIFAELANQYGITERVVRHYHEHWRQTSKEVRPVLDKIQEIGAQEDELTGMT
jgi:hypothetical protein